MPLSTALKATNSEWVLRAISRASVVLPQPGGPHRIIEPSWSRSMATRSGCARTEQRLLADEFVQRARAHAFGQRRAGRGSVRRFEWSEKAHDFLVVADCASAALPRGLIQ